MSSFSRIIFIAILGLLLHALPLFGQWGEAHIDLMSDSLYRAGVRAITISGVGYETHMSMRQNDTGLFVEINHRATALTSYASYQYNKRNLVVKIMSETKIFDLPSNRIELYKYNDNDSIVEKKTLYDDGLKTKKTRVEIDEKYSYDASERLIQVKQFADNQLKLTGTLKYNAIGKLVEREQMWGPTANDNVGAFRGEKVRKETFFYDSLQRLISYQMFKDDSLDESTTYSYIEGIRRVTTVESTPSWIGSKTTVTAFDSTGKEIEQVKYGSDNMLTSLTLKRYNAKGKLTKEIIYSKGLLSSWAETLYFYNANDDLVRKEMRGKDEPLVTLYEYDSKGNIIQETSMTGEKTLNTTKYSYTYAK